MSEKPRRGRRNGKPVMGTDPDDPFMARETARPPESGGPSQKKREHTPEHTGTHRTPDAPTRKSTSTFNTLRNFARAITRSPFKNRDANKQLTAAVAEDEPYSPSKPRANHTDKRTRRDNFRTHMHQERGRASVPHYDSNILGGLVPRYAVPADNLDEVPVPRPPIHEFAFSIPGVDLQRVTHPTFYRAPAPPAPITRAKEPEFELAHKTPRPTTATSAHDIPDAPQAPQATQADPKTQEVTQDAGRGSPTPDRDTPAAGRPQDEDPAPAPHAEEVDDEDMASLNADAAGPFIEAMDAATRAISEDILVTYPHAREALTRFCMTLGSIPGAEPVLAGLAYLNSRMQTLEDLVRGNMTPAAQHPDQRPLVTPTAASQQPHTSAKTGSSHPEPAKTPAGDTSAPATVTEPHANKDSSPRDAGRYNPRRAIFLPERSAPKSPGDLASLNAAAPALRNAINARLATAHKDQPGAPRVVGVNWTPSGNLCIIAQEGMTGADLVRDRAIIADAAGLGQGCSATEDIPWHRAVLRDVPVRSPTGTLNTGADVLAELRAYNPRFNTLKLAPTGEPVRWLATDATRESKTFSSVLICFARAEDEASFQELARSLFVFGRACASGKFTPRDKMRICTTCWNPAARHSARDHKCTPHCRLCAGPHKEADHVCITCRDKHRTLNLPPITSPVPCEHVGLKCCNCGRPHYADDHRCEARRRFTGTRAGAPPMTGANATKLRGGRGRKRGPPVAAPDAPFPDPQPQHPPQQPAAVQPEHPAPPQAAPSETTTPAADATQAHTDAPATQDKAASAADDQSLDMEVDDDTQATGAPTSTGQRPFTIGDARVKSARTQGKTQDRAAKRSKIASMMAKRFNGVTIAQCNDFLNSANDDLTTALLSMRENYRGPKPSDDTLHAFREQVDKQLDAKPAGTAQTPAQ
ncbi:hypothetical protein EXIGLDRAFT_762723 [Exidia glandulosa HHB12029]|uniref:Uncharacterized protein n=1 Tax=Exidia glandulosa HHB12029 TaxID=1314781 RepID=A0A165ML51_EXIGL|nr:hypothetical protein EXIGLDRAFT_762723 [Exidia glandulosa HHB12029]